MRDFEEEPVEIHIGRELPNGAVRYVARPIEWTWVALTLAASVAIVIFLLQSDSAKPAVALIFIPLPLLVMFHGGFDIRLREGEMYVWQALGPIRYSSFSVPRLKIPEPRTALEEGEEGTRKYRVTYLYWGNRSIRVTLKRDQLNELLAEAEAVVGSARTPEQ